MKKDWRSQVNNPFVLEFQLRLADTDSLGHLNNVSYVEFLETLRTQWHVHVRQTRDALRDWDWILGGIYITFRKEGYLSDDLTGYMWCSRVGTKSWDFSYALVNQDQDIILEARTTQIGYDYENKQSKKISDDIQNDLSSRMGKSWDEIE